MQTVMAALTAVVAILFVIVAVIFLPLLVATAVGFLDIVIDAVRRCGARAAKPSAGGVVSGSTPESAPKTSAR